MCGAQSNATHAPRRSLLYPFPSTLLGTGCLLSPSHLQGRQEARRQCENATIYAFSFASSVLVTDVHHVRLAVVAWSDNSRSLKSMT